MSAARKHDDGWLSEHALRSGLVEQFATEVAGLVVLVELKWVRHHDNFAVTHRIDTTVAESAQYARLADARERFVRCVHRARSIPGRNLS